MKNLLACAYQIGPYISHCDCCLELSATPVLYRWMSDWALEWKWILQIELMYKCSCHGHVYLHYTIYNMIRHSLPTAPLVKHYDIPKRDLMFDELITVDQGCSPVTGTLCPVLILMY